MQARGNRRFGGIWFKSAVGWWLSLHVFMFQPVCYYVVESRTLVSGPENSHSCWVCWKQWMDRFYFCRLKTVGWWMFHNVPSSIGKKSSCPRMPYLIGRMNSSTLWTGFFSRKIRWLFICFPRLKVIFFPLIHPPFWEWVLFGSRWLKQIKVSATTVFALLLCNEDPEGRASLMTRWKTVANTDRWRDSCQWFQRRGVHVDNKIFSNSTDLRWFLQDILSEDKRQHGEVAMTNLEPAGTTGSWSWRPSHWQIRRPESQTMSGEARTVVVAFQLITNVQ